MFWIEQCSHVSLCICEVGRIHSPEGFYEGIAFSVQTANFCHVFVEVFGRQDTATFIRPGECIHPVMFANCVVYLVDCFGAVFG